MSKHLMQFKLESEIILRQGLQGDGMFHKLGLLEDISSMIYDVVTEMEEGFKKFKTPESMVLAQITMLPVILSNSVRKPLKLKGEQVNRIRRCLNAAAITIILDSLYDTGVLKDVDKLDALTGLFKFITTRDFYSLMYGGSNMAHSSEGDVSLLMRDAYLVFLFEAVFQSHKPVSNAIATLMDKTVEAAKLIPNADPILAVDRIIEITAAL